MKLERLDLEQRIKSFALLGEVMRDSINDDEVKKSPFKSQISHLNSLIQNQININPWFTTENVKRAIGSIAQVLTAENLTKWIDQYKLNETQENPVNVAVIMAGNIPLVGFHDFLCVLITGNNVIAKTSTRDSRLITALSTFLCDINPAFKSRINITEDILSGFDAVIATGSDNSSRYFEYYFSKYPHIIRKNRQSIAILDGDETDKELSDLGDDIFSYFGLGCRNVSKLYVPKGYDILSVTKNWKRFENITNSQKYSNNYDYNKAVYLINKEVFHDTGYLLLKEDARIASPVSVLYYEFYESKDAVKQIPQLLKEKIQCVISKDNIPFGKAQSPNLWDYADGIDTIDFLLKKNLAGIL